MMRITNLVHDSKVYTSNVYLVTGTWNALCDTNTLVDVGRDPAIFAPLEAMSTGVGKRRVEQIILTHNHYDHTGLLRRLCETYQPDVLAFTSANACVTRLVRDGDIVQCGDRSFRVVHTPGHSSDSICLYCADDHVLFAGDTPLRRSSGASYTEEFVEAIARLSALDIQQIYYGHGAPLLTGANAMIADILRATHTAQGAGAGGA